MNGVPELSSVKRSTSPRPPAVGEEVKTQFYDTSQRFQEPYRSWNMEYQQKLESAEKPASSSCTETAAECTTNASNSSPPSAYKWAQNLLCLLEDIQGVSLFQQFLKQECLDTKCLSFWFACRGVKKNDPKDREGLIKVIKVIFEKKVKRISAISDETKEEIHQKLQTNTGIDDTIFDAAQKEAEAYMMKSTYPNFLKSDLYIQHLEELQNEKDSLASPEPVDLLPTVHEDAELHIASNNKIPLTKNNLLQRNKVPYVSKVKSEGPAGYLRSPYSTYTSYHSKYGSFLPASAQDSELQSLSSDAQTDDTMSITDCSSVDYPVYCRNKQKRSQKSAKHNAVLNKDKLSHGAFIPRTERLPTESMHPKRPEELHALLVKKLNKVLDDQRMNHKMSEKLKAIENSESAKPEGTPASSAYKSNPTPMLEPSSFFCNQTEENVQDILDQHISRVFNDSGPHTPSAGCTSPPTARPSVDSSDKSRVPLQGLANYDQPRDYSMGATHKFNQVPEFTVPNSIRYRKDHDTRSTDSAMVDYISDDNMPSTYRNPYSSDVDGRRSKDHTKRSASKKFSPMTDSTSSFVDSGISLACESVVNSKVSHWLENRRITEQEREQWRNSSTSPVPSRPCSSRRVFSSRCGSQEIGYSMWPAAASQQMPQESFMPNMPLPDITSNLLEARRRLEDESRAKMKSKSTSGARLSSHDASRLKISKGYDSVDDGSHKKSRKSCPGSFPPTAHVSNGDVTVICYSYDHQEVPYLSRYPGKNVTLRQFKSLLSKKGNFKYFFKTPFNDFGTGVVLEEVSDDSEVLPLWEEGKIFCVIEPVDET